MARSGFDTTLTFRARENFINDHMLIQEKCDDSQCGTPRRMSVIDIYDIEADPERSGCEDEMTTIGWDTSSCRSASSPSQHAIFHDWFRERRISDESDWQPDLAEMCLQLAGEDFRIFALEDQKCLLTRADSSSTISEMSNRCQWSPLWIPSDNHDFRHGKELLKSLDFDAMSYSQDVLAELIVEIFVELELHDRLALNRSTLESFVLSVRSRMLENPYHNWVHACDVVQAAYCLGLQSGLISSMTDIEKFALLLAALCHDLEHPGVTNLYLVKSRSTLAQLYDMAPACLETHHSFRAFELLTSADHEGILDIFAQEERADFLRRVERLILATDMSRHAEFSTALRADIDRGRTLEPGGPAWPEAGERERGLLLELLIKAADSSNVLRPFPVAKRWAVRIMDEFFQQGDLERSRGMDVTRTCDRTAQSRVEAQRGFLDCVAAPFLRLFAARLPGLTPVLDRLAATRAMWDGYDSDEALQRELLAELLLGQEL